MLRRKRPVLHDTHSVHARRRRKWATGISLRDTAPCPRHTTHQQPGCVQRLVKCGEAGDVGQAGSNVCQGRQDSVHDMQHAIDCAGRRYYDLEGHIMSESNSKVEERGISF